MDQILYTLYQMIPHQFFPQSQHIGYSVKFLNRCLLNGGNNSFRVFSFYIDFFFFLKSGDFILIKILFFQFFLTYALLNSLHISHKMINYNLSPQNSCCFFNYYCASKAILPVILNHLLLLTILLFLFLYSLVFINYH